ncbi:MAG: MBL fold metallo-hydrolase [Verrucomicrobia bacterium]|nr:MBL fold metallo-hydrolase [Verrucomicrobiota bacterium]NBU09583.1 MBL fold metallo-hydrolase [Pseudomonadota bacterium]NDD38557.1 MBL fold metallo-hydrolase [Verrucomicrobiota bacterium]NDE97782.1 MBL fold metallo-hydrolase [Verrucomicrobiota bacterium]
MCGEWIHRGTENPEGTKRAGKAALPFPVSTVPLWLILPVLSVALPQSIPADLAVRRIEISPPSSHSRVPAATAQGRLLAPQAISAVHVSADGKFITVGTMAHSHDANVWQLAPDGSVLAKRHLPPWAPIQVATLDGGKALAVGLAYSRVTSPEPTVWLGGTDALLRELLKDTFVEADTRDSELARLRPGAGDWRTGWFASHLGELFVHGPDWAFKPPGLFLHADGSRTRLRYEDKNQLPTSRPTSMAASRDGKRAAFGWLSLNQPVDMRKPRQAVSVWSVNPNRPLWTAPASDDVAASALPNPAADLPELAKDGFRLAADVVAPGTVTAAVALNADGSRVALVEYGVQIWTRSGPAIGKWDPPIHTLNFVPTQRGRLRVFDGSGKEILREWLPEAGLFEVGFGGDADAVWCWPTSWFARGMAGEPWLPVQADARTVYRVDLATRATTAFAFADAIADCVPCPADGRVLVSGWDGQVALLGADGKVVAKLELNASARLAWSGDGTFAVVGTANGQLAQLERDGKLNWRQNLSVAEPPAITTLPAEIVAGLPVYQGGRIPQSEHAYVGDIWVLKLGREAVVVDAGGTSGFALSQARVKALGIERVTHVLHTHSHGDHSGGAYLWRAAGAKIVGPKSAALTLTWLMPMLTDYGIFPPRPLDVPLPLARVGDETEFAVSEQKFRALFVPGHSFDLTVYMTELGGKRVAFTGDLGFERESDIVHRCWGDAEKACPVIKAIREKLLAWKPDVVFTGHGVRPNGTEWVEDLLRRSEESLAKAAVKGDSK